MKNFKTVTDTALLIQIKLDAASERHSGLAVIHQLREIARRRLDAKLGHPSLFMFCVDELKYSRGSAHRRVKAMQALGDLPDLETKLESGELNLTNVSQVETFCQANQKAPEEKKAIFDQIQGKSKRETETLLAELAPEPVRKDRLKPKGKEKTELRVTLDQSTVDTLEKIRDLIAHSHPGASYSDLIKYLAELGLKKLDPTFKVGRAPKVGSTGEPETAPTERPVPKPIKREVWKRDGSRCTYVAPSGRACVSTAFIQIDHIIPRAKGGTNGPCNLRLRCQKHNLFAAAQEFGAKKIEGHMRK